MSERESLIEARETVGWEVVIRFFPGSGVEASEFYAAINLPEQAKWIRLDRIVTPEGEERLQLAVLGRA